MSEDRLREYNATYYEANKERILENRAMNKASKKEYDKQYYLNNSDIIKADVNEYYKQNRDKLRFDQYTYNRSKRLNINQKPPNEPNYNQVVDKIVVSFNWLL